MKEEIFLFYNCYISKEYETCFEITAKNKLDLSVLDYIAFLFDKPVILKEVSPAKVDNYFKKVIFAHKSQSEVIAASLGQASGTSSHEKITVNYNDAPVIRLVNSILEEAVNSKASDVHIEPMDTQMHTRYRIDGELKEALTSPIDYFEAVSSRVKLLANLDITQRLEPQDGKAQVEVSGMLLDLRVSTIPTKYGESIVIRILNREEDFINLSRIGFSKKTEQNIRDLLKMSNGLILLTGPTGSGKTTTLYAMLKILNKPNVKIITVENPVEYEIAGINQVEINPLQGMSFPKILRHFLRHDPDIIMIGEIRDEETARIAVQASLTGHLVLSTLHTNDTVSAITRLIDLGIEPYLIASSLKGILSQRLVKKMCSKCRKKIKSTDLPPDIKKYLPRSKKTKKNFIYTVKGCKTCNNSGYQGRTAVSELLLIDSNTRRFVTMPNPEAEFNKYLAKNNFKKLPFNIINKMLSGITSVDEAQRLLYSDK